MATLDLAWALITKRENILYLSGFSGSSGALLISADAQWLVSDFRYMAQASEEAPAWTFVCAERALLETVSQFLADHSIREVGFEPDAMSFADYTLLSGDEKAAPYVLRPTARLVEQLRLCKEPEELELIRQAVRITDEAYAHILTLVAPGVTEQELALAAEWYMRSHGADGLAFDIIVATGSHGALPHAQPGARALQPGDLVVVDMGARYHHYCADMTRTFAVAEATAIARKIYRVCVQGQLAGIANINGGMTGQAADQVVRAVIEQAGYGDYFGHGTGHGVGLEIHEAPRASRFTDDLLPSGATLTIEPGIYLPEIGGVRIEDLTVISDHGVEVLTAAPKPAELPVYG
jgi:Xaa-Pro aminopeptidase